MIYIFWSFWYASQKKTKFSNDSIIATQIWNVDNISSYNPVFCLHSYVNLFQENIGSNMRLRDN